MKRWRRGGVTVFVSLMMAVILTFFQICLQSAQDGWRRSQTEEALELAELSVLSEYRRELLETYDLFYLDLGYGTGVEDVEYLKGRLKNFLNVNLPDGQTKAAEVWDFSRATDGNGMALYEQAVSCMRQKMGVSLADAWKEYGELGAQAQEFEAVYEGSEEREETNLEELKKRRREEEEEGTEDPTVGTRALKGGSILHLVLPEVEMVSGKCVDLSEVPSVRNNLTGAGPRGRYEGNLGNDAFFCGYLQEHFTDAVDCLTEEVQPGGWLDYQMEYLIAGKEADMDNLENVCGRILAVREGANYAYLKTDAGKSAECEALAAALVGATLIPGLVEAMKQVLLLTWAFGESVVDVRMLLEGKKTVFWKDSNTWKLSLEGALNLEHAVTEEETSDDEEGLSYQDYLGILLAMTGREKKTARSLDVIEGVIRGTSGGRRFYLDECIDGFRMRAVIQNGQEWTAERMFCYEW